MMRILVISDSHGQLENLNKVLKQVGKIDRVIHLGDILNQDEKLREMCSCPVTIVKGNCDFYTENQLVEVVEIGKNRIFATHGHRFGVDWELNDLCNAAIDDRCNIALYGHTHVSNVSYYKNVIVMNPGSLSKPRQINPQPTYGIITIDEDGDARADIYVI